MSAYNPPLSETDAKAGPPPYENTAKASLLVIAWVSFIFGFLLTFGTLISTEPSMRELTGTYPSMVALMFGVLFLIVGAGALFAYLGARSVTYDLLYRFGPHPDYVPPAARVEAESAHLETTR